MGGIGGPYRLDAGHDVHQVSDEVKEQVPEHIRYVAYTYSVYIFFFNLKKS